MSTGSPVLQPRPVGDEDRLRAALIGLLVVLGVAVVGLLWAKWLPYLDRAQTISGSGEYPGSSTLDKAGSAGDAPSLSGAWTFTQAYVTAIWQALVVGLVFAAAIQALLPARWIGQ